MRKYLLIFLISTFLIVPFVFAQESLTITTYYPAPFGAYQNLQLVPTNTVPACNANQEGVMYYDNAQNQVMICREVSPNVFQPQPLGAHWILSGNFLTAANTVWNVGVGTGSPWDPAYKFVVGGNTWLGGNTVTTGHNYTYGSTVTYGTSYNFGDIYAPNNPWNSCYPTYLGWGSHYVGCANGYYVVGLLYEGAEWHHVQDSHSYPEIYGVWCCSL